MQPEPVKTNGILDQAEDPVYRTFNNTNTIDEHVHSG